MKNKKTLILMLIVLSIFSFASCKKDPPHEHSFSSSWTYDSDYHWHEASCGHDVTSGNARHSWNAGSVTTAPTHTTEGVKTYACTVCGAVKTEPVPANSEDHTFSTTWSSDATYHWHAATCGHTTLKSQQSAHTWDNGMVTTVPTHSKAGVKTYFCTVCGQTKTESIPATDHTFSSEWSFDATYHWHAATCSHTTLKSEESEHLWNTGVVTTEPTHTKTGVKTYTCTVCGHIKTEPVPALSEEHTFSTDWSSDASYHWHAATCSHTTLKSQQSEHTWNDGEVTTNPTHTTAGVKTYTCTVCGKTKTESVPALTEDHSFSSDWSFDATYHWHAATCGHTILKSQQSVHTWNNGEITTPATCTKAGVKTYTCTICGKTKTESIPASGHAYDSGEITTAAGCTTTGVKTFTCANCNDTYTESIPATGHAFDSGVITTSAGCTTTGVKTFTCANCNDTYTESIPATGHAYDGGVITTSAGCTTTGVKTFTCANCNDTYTDSIPAIGHAYSSNWASNAYYHWHAAICEHTEEKDSYGAHSFPAKATAVDQGDGTYKFEKKCTECGYSVVVSTANIGDIGPAGGIVFYDKGEYTDGWRFLEAAPADLRVVFETPTVDSSLPAYSDAPAEYVFGVYRTSINGSNLYVNGTTTYSVTNCTVEALGAGKANTDLLVSAMGDNTYSTGITKTAQYAAKLCSDLEYNGFDDWFLPSSGELYMMYVNMDIIGGFESTYYWASLESRNYTDMAKQYGFGKSGQSSTTRDYFRYYPARVRPIREF